MNDAPSSSRNLSPQEKRELLQKMLMEKAAKNSKSTDSGLSFMPRQNRDKKFFPLSSSQQRILFLEQLEPNTAVYNNSFAFRLHGRCT